MYMWSFAVLFSVIVLAIAYQIVTQYPEIVLKVPKIGYVLYHFVSGAPIPPFIVDTQWKNDTSWLHSGDIVVSCWIKGGTTWGLVTAHSIRTKGVVDYDSLLDVVPWVDFVRYPGETLAERVTMFRRVAAKYPYAIYKTHSSPSPTGIQLRSDVKYIVGVRSLVDSCASLVTFLPGHTEKFTRLWGDFPPRQQTADEFETWVLDDMGGGVGYISIQTEFLRNWWAHRHDPNVLFVHYGNRLKDPEADINNFAKFMGVDLTLAEKQAVITVSSFDVMKANNHKYAYCLSNASDSVQQLSNKLSSPLCAMEDHVFVAKGKARNGRKEFSAHLVKRINDRCLEEFGAEICEWLETGGPPPDVDLPARPATPV